MNQKIKKLIIIILAILLLIAGYFLFLQKPETAAADWWDDSWLYRQTVGITNSGTAETDFQVMITVDTATLITANKLQSDCDDIRITDISGKLLDYWIEPSTCNTASTKIWTKVPSISTSGDTVYLYYGNSAVDSKSSTADTFIREISGVQGAWDMDGSGAIATNDTLADSSGNTNTGTASNVNTTGMTYASSQYEQGVDFDGVDDYVNAGNGSSLNLDAGAFSIEFWVNPNIVTTDQFIIDKLSDNVNAGYGLTIQGSKIYGYFPGNSAQVEYSITANEWSHWIATRDGSGNITLYKNGTSVDTGSSSADLDTAFDLTIGGRIHGSYQWYLNGSLDGVRIYNQALSQTEITDLYGTGGDRQGYTTTNYPNKSLVRKYSALVSVGSPASEERGPGPVAFWKFDEGFGQTANDSTINANNGTLGSAPGSDANDPTWQTEDMCVSGKCLKFDGVDDYISKTSISPDFDNKGEISISAWFKPNSLNTSGDNKFIISLPESSAGSNGIDIKQNNATISFDLVTHSAQSLGIITKTLTDTNWHHINLTYDGATLSGYMDGNLIGTTSVTLGTGLKHASKEINFGRFGTLSGHNFNGFIDSVKIYPYARTVAQIKADYASRGTASGSSVVISDEGKKSLSDGLVGYWKMDEASWTNDCSTTSVLDASGSGNNGKACPNTTGPVGGATGKFGNGGLFDGSDDYVDLNSTWTSPTYNNFAIAFWYKSGQTTPTDDQYVFVDGDPVAIQTSIMCGITDDTGYVGNVRMHMRGAGFTDKYNGINVMDQTWHHIICQRSGDDIIFYTDGIQTTDGTFSSSITPSSGHTFIGDDPGATEQVNGSIDEVRIYNRALSPGEVRDLYNFAPGPVGWWKMDEKVSGNGQTINDSSRYGNTGTTSSANGTGMDCMVQGKYGSACEFDGVDDYVNAGSGSSLNITNAITVEAWVKTPSSGGYQSIVGKGGFSDSYWFALSATARKLTFYLDGVVNYNTVALDLWSLNEWYHLVATYDSNIGSDNLNFYVNGSLREASTQSGTITQTGGNLYIGKNSFYGFNGSIDDVRIYNYARTQAQIMEDYSAGAGRKQPVGHWKFDEGYGTTANNFGIGGSALNGTLTNMSSPATSTSGWTDSGKMGKGLVFDGGDDFVDCGNDSSLDSYPITLGAWVKTSGSGTNRGIATKYASASSNGYQIYINNGRIKTWYFKSASDYTRQDADGDDGGLINDGIWHYVTYVVDSSGGKIYIDGVLKNTKIWTGTAGVTTTSQQFQIGSYDTIGFNGTIDDVKIYNYALTEDEVRQEYNQGALLKLGSTGTDSSGNPDDSASREYCIPGDATACDPPVGRWDFNEGAGSTVNDTSGKNNTGTWSGAGEHWDLGKVGFGGSFNGSDDYVDVGSENNLNITGNITVEAWIYPTSWPATNAKIVSRYSGGNGYYLERQSTVFIFYLFNAWNYSYAQFTFSDGDILNKWNYITATWDGTNTRIYLNGVIKETRLGDYTAGSVSTNFYVGMRDIGVGHYFNGSIDQVRIYDYARTPAQIAWDYNRGKPIAHWKFDECQGGTAYDSSGNGNNGTITIGATAPQTALGTCTSGASTDAWYNGRTGKYSSGMSFDGVDDYVTVLDNSSLNITDAITISAWIKVGGDSAYSAYQRIVHRSNGNGYVFYYDRNQQLIGIARDVSGWQQWAYSYTTLSDNIWYHVVGVYDGTNQMVYLNGIAGTPIATPNYPSVSTTLYIGNTNTGTRSFNGLIDEVKIYNYALTAEQIKVEYNGGAVNFR